MRELLQLKRQVGHVRALTRQHQRMTFTAQRFLLLQKNNYFLDENTANNNSSLELFPDWTTLVSTAASCETAPPAPMSLFQWQIQQEELRVAGASAELLSEQDADGDT